MINSNLLGVSDFSSDFTERRKERIIRENEEPLWNPKIGISEKKIGEDKLRKKKGSSPG